MSDHADRIQRELDALRQRRDEIKLQAHLGKAEVRDIWFRLEDVWPHVELRLRELEMETGSAKRRLTAATRALMRELEDGYRQLS